MRFLDRIINIFLSEQNKVKTYCQICNRPIFNLNSEFGKEEMCVYCNTAYNKGVMSVYAKGGIVEKIIKSV